MGITINDITNAPEFTEFVRMVMEARQQEEIRREDQRDAVKWRSLPEVERRYLEAKYPFLRD